MNDTEVLAGQDGMVMAEVVVAAMVTAYKHCYSSHYRENQKNHHPLLYNYYPLIYIQYILLVHKLVRRVITSSLHILLGFMDTPVLRSIFPITLPTVYVCVCMHVCVSVCAYVCGSIQIINRPKSGHLCL